MYNNVYPRFMALFQKRIEGDDTLLQLASIRFRESGLGTEFYADTPSELDWLLGFVPSPECPVVVHLPRKINILERESRRLILDFASKYSGRIYGLVIHDQYEIVDCLSGYIEALQTIQSALAALHEGPLLFIEYAVGLEPNLFIDLFTHIHHLKQVSACVDIGHVGMRQAREDFLLHHPEKDVCALSPHDTSLKEVIEDVESAVHTALPTVLNVIQKLGNLKKPLHLHLHDGHPLSTFSAFGVSDHISFLSEIPIPFEYRGGKRLKPMFGPFGLTDIVGETVKVLDTELLSFTLEIHPADKGIPLGNASHLFNHWKDRTNAERMNSWLITIQQNQSLLLDAWKKYNENLLIT